MRYHGKYNVDPADIVDGAIRWKSTGSGAYIIAERRGVKYFVKRYTMGPRIPAKTIPDPVYSELLENARWLERKQAEIRKLFKAIRGDKGRIVKEEKNFWDEDNLFVTVTRMIPDENAGFDYTKLDQDAFVKLCFDIAELIKLIHYAGVTHGDLKIKNILIQKSDSELVPYLIDFDSSYPSDYGKRKRRNGKPMLSHPVVFSEGYQSPEIAIYNYEEEGKIPASTITDKTDIFTLAVIFHCLWTGSFPTVVDDDCAVGEAVYLDRTILIDPKFDTVLGKRKGVKFSSLLMWMLAKKPTERPTAKQVMDVLAGKRKVPDKYVAKFRPATPPAAPKPRSTSRYSVRPTTTARPTPPAHDTVVSVKASAPPRSESNDFPWPEHGAEYNVRGLRADDIVKVEKIVERGEHQYRLTIMTDRRTDKLVVRGDYMKKMQYIY